MMLNEENLMFDLAALLQKHKLKAGILLVPIELDGEQGTTCLRINCDENTAARIMGNVAEDIKNGTTDVQNLRDH